MMTVHPQLTSSLPSFSYPASFRHPPPASSARPKYRPFLYFVVGFDYPCYFVICSSLFGWFRVFWWASTFFCTPGVIRSCELYSTVHHFGDCFFVRLGRNWRLPSNVSNKTTLFMSGFPTLRTSNQNFTLAPLLLLFFVVNIPDSGSSCKCNRTSLFSPKWLCDFGAVTTISGCGQCCLYIHWQIKLLGFGASLNSIVATSAEYAVHLSIFQLPQRTHHEIQIFQLAPVRNFFVMAKASVDVHTSTCSSSSSQSSFPSTNAIVGNHPRPWQQFHKAIPHGEENPVQRNRTSRLLLHPSPCQQPWWTSKILRHQRNWQSSQILEGKTSATTCSPSCTMATFTNFGNETWQRCLPHMSILQDTTWFLFNHRPRASSSSSSLLFWIVYATTKSTQPDGLTMKPLHVLAQACEVFRNTQFLKTNISFWTATPCTLTTSLWHLLPRDHLKTKSSHLTKRSQRHLGRLWHRGQRKNHFHQFPVKHWLTFGTGLGSDALPSYKITSLTSTMSDSNNSSTMLCSTMRTNELHHSEYTVRVFTMNTCRTPSETPRFFGKWTPTPRKWSTTPSPRSPRRSARPTHGHWDLAGTFQTPMSSPKGKSIFALEDQLWVFSQLLFDLCWIALRSWSTSYCQRPFHTIWRRAMSSTSFNTSKHRTSTRHPPHRSTTRIWPASLSA